MITGMVSDMIVHSTDQEDIILSAHMQTVMDTFRASMFERIYHSQQLAKERQQAVFVLRELFEHFRKHPEELPEEFLQREERWGREQTVVDYVAGLTDSYAVQLFHKIFIPPVGLMVQ